MSSLPKDKIKSQGAIRIHEPTGQLRYTADNLTGDNAKVKTDQYLQPLSAYRTGSTLIKAGTPVSIASDGEILNKVDANSYEPMIVESSGLRHRWTVGLAQEPVSSDPEANSPYAKKFAHVVSTGKFIWNLIDYTEGDKKDFIAWPPIATSDNKTNFTWTYENDVGKPVYVNNNRPTTDASPFTLNLEDAYFGGASIITVGYLADAPMAAQVSSGDPDVKRIVIEVKPSGDSRGLQDSTEFAVTLKDDESSLDASEVDRLILVKILQNGTGEVVKHVSDLEPQNFDSSQRVPVGAFVAKASESEVVLAGKTVTLTRFGIVDGNFGFGEAGLDLFLTDADGEVKTQSDSDLVEYRVGTILKSNGDVEKVLVDCRNAKFFKKFDPIGTVKPIYADGREDPGYVRIESNREYFIARPTDDSTSPVYPELAKALRFSNEAQFFSASGIKVDPIADGVPTEAGSYFMLSEIYYKVYPNDSAPTGRISAQIKYTKEATEEKAQELLWPHIDVTFPYTCERGGKPRNSISDADSVNITSLVDVGDVDVLDDVEVSVVVKAVYGMVDSPEGKIEANLVDDPNVGLKIPEGIQRITLTNGSNFQEQYVGYQWKFYKSANQGGTINFYAQLVTSLDDDDTEDIPFRGICFPNASMIGRETDQKIIDLDGAPKYSKIDLAISFRRKLPTKYNGLLLNQLYSDSTWNSNSFSDGTNLGIPGSIFLGGGINNGGIAEIFNASEFGISTDEDDRGFYGDWVRVTSEKHRAFLEGASGKDAVFVDKKSTQADGASKTIKTEYNFKTAEQTSYASRLSGHLAATSTAESTLAVDGKKTRITTQSNANFDALRLFRELPIKNYSFEADYAAKQNNRIGPTSASTTSHLSVATTNPVMLSDIFSEQVETYPVTLEDKTRLAQVIKKIVASDGDSDYAIEEIDVAIGALMKAAADSQDRLLTIERVLYGMDSPTIPNVEAPTNANFGFGTLNSVVKPEGIGRLASQLSDVDQNYVEKEGEKFKFEKFQVFPFSPAKTTYAGVYYRYLNDLLNTTIDQNGYATADNFAEERGLLTSNDETDGWRVSSSIDDRLRNEARRAIRAEFKEETARQAFDGAKFDEEGANDYNLIFTVDGMATSGYDNNDSTTLSFLTKEAGKSELIIDTKASLWAAIEREAKSRRNSAISQLKIERYVEGDWQTITNTNTTRPIGRLRLTFKNFYGNGTKIYNVATNEFVELQSANALTVSGIATTQQAELIRPSITGALQINADSETESVTTISPDVKITNGTIDFTGSTTKVRTITETEYEGTQCESEAVNVATLKDRIEKERLATQKWLPTEQVVQNLSRNAEAGTTLLERIMDDYIYNYIQLSIKTLDSHDNGHGQELVLAQTVWQTLTSNCPEVNSHWTKITNKLGDVDYVLNALKDQASIQGNEYVVDLLRTITDGYVVLWRGEDKNNEGEVIFREYVLQVKDTKGNDFYWKVYADDSDFVDRAELVDATNDAILKSEGYTNIELGKKSVLTSFNASGQDGSTTLLDFLDKGSGTLVTESWVKGYVQDVISRLFPSGNK
jgi:hypothetical protein